MLKFIVRRIFWTIPVLLVVIFLTFTMMRQIEGNPFRKTERNVPESIQRNLETLSGRTKRDVQPEVARRRVLQLKLAKRVAKSARHQLLAVHQPDRHVGGARRRLLPVRELSNQHDKPGSKLLLQL